MLICAICREDISTENFKVAGHMSCCGAGYHLQCLLIWFGRQSAPRCLICQDSYAMMVPCSSCRQNPVAGQEWLYILQALYLAACGQQPATRSPNFIAQLFSKSRVDFSNPEIASCFLTKCSQLVSNDTTVVCLHDSQRVCNTAFAIFASSNPASLERQRARKKILRSIFSLTSHCLTLTTASGTMGALQDPTLSFERLIEHLAEMMNAPEYVKHLRRLAEYPNSPRQVVASPLGNLSVPFSSMMQKVFSLNQSELQQIFQQQGLENFQQLIESQLPITDIRYLPNCMAVNADTNMVVHKLQGPQTSINIILILSTCIATFSVIIVVCCYLLAKKIAALEWVVRILAPIYVSLVFLLSYMVEHMMTPRARVQLAVRMENNLSYLVLLAAMLIAAMWFL